MHGLQFQTLFSRLSPGPLPLACLYVWLSGMTDYWGTCSHRAAFRTCIVIFLCFFHGAGTTIPHVSVSPLIGLSHRSFQSNACRSGDAIGCSQSMSNVFTL